MTHATQRDELPRIRVEYARAGVAAAGSLASIRFGLGEHPKPSVSGDPALTIDVALEPLNQPHWIEHWPAFGPVSAGKNGLVRYASDAHHVIALIEVDEREYGGIAEASAAVYRELRRFQSQRSYPHLLRVWNYFDAINAGEGDQERYREFCVGRTNGWAAEPGETFPAASAIGTQSVTHRLQVYWLSARHPGLSLENPRQVSAFRYPRDYGPTPPTFARAMKVSDDTLLISGTASIVGHASQHHGDTLAQLDETIRNLQALHEHAALPARGNAAFKVYLRDRAQLDAIEARLRAQWPSCQLLVLAADICRSELLLEIEGVFSAR